MIYNAYADQSDTMEGMTLISCGHIFAKPGREILRPQGREDWLLFYIAKGSETFYLPHEVAGKAGSFILFAPGEVQHHIYQGTETAEFYYVHFNCAALPSPLTLQSSRLYDLPPHRRFCDLFEAMLEELQQKAPCHERLCLCHFWTLLTLLEREVVHRTHPQKEHLDRIGRAIQHINRFYDSDLSLEDYAAMCHMSKFHFLRVFREIAGSTPLDYRNRIRLEHAADLLENERLSVEEIALQTGFSSASYFSSAFKKKFGLSPKQYRKQK